jgi:hypothetical protein
VSSLRRPYAHSRAPDIFVASSAAWDLVYGRNTTAYVQQLRQFVNLVRTELCTEGRQPSGSDSSPPLATSSVIIWNLASATNRSLLNEIRAPYLRETSILEYNRIATAIIGSIGCVVGVCGYFFAFLRLLCAYVTVCECGWGVVVCVFFFLLVVNVCVCVVFVFGFTCVGVFFVLSFCAFGACSWIWFSL